MHNFYTYFDSNQPFYLGFNNSQHILTSNNILFYTPFNAGKTIISNIAFLFKIKHPNSIIYIWDYDNFHSYLFSYNKLLSLKFNDITFTHNYNIFKSLYIELQLRQSSNIDSLSPILIVLDDIDRFDLNCPILSFLYTEGFKYKIFFIVRSSSLHNTIMPSSITINQLYDNSYTLLHNSNGFALSELYKLIFNKPIPIKYSYMSSYLNNDNWLSFPNLYHSDYLNAFNSVNPITLSDLNNQNPASSVLSYFDL